MVKIPRIKHDKHALGKESLRQFLTRPKGLGNIMDMTELELANSGLELAKLTMATCLAQKAHEKIEEKKNLLDLVPKKYHDYLDIFQDFPDQCLLPSWPYDHAITLDDSFVPQKEPPYSLLPAETEALNDFLQENLRKGFICTLKLL